MRRCALPVKRECLQCGAVFEVRPCAASVRKHCSKQCHNDSMARETARYRGRAGGSRPEHIRVVESAIGRRLPKGANVHHVNGNHRDNRPKNLVVCQNAAYHKLLHLRARVLRAGGNPNTQRICCGCQRVLDIQRFGSGGLGKSGSTRRPCLQCAARYTDERRRRRGIHRSEAGRKYQAEAEAVKGDVQELINALKALGRVATEEMRLSR